MNDHENKKLATLALEARNGTDIDLSSLNEQQKLAVTTTSGPVLVLAGAGTGKTKVLTTRIAYILQQNLAYANQILAVTFTNKAAAEIKERLQHMLGDNYFFPWIGTFHYIGLKILRSYHDIVGLSKNFSILDDKSAVDFMQKILQGQQIDSDKNLAKKMLHIIDQWKREGLKVEDINDNDSPLFHNGKEKIIFKIYQERLQSLNSVDFNDILAHPLFILQNNPHILEKYQKQFRYILIDEYQDINNLQYLLMRLIAQKPAGQTVNFFCVGDEDQTIYKWRGAHVERLLNFQKDFESSTIIQLERNYRSTQHILSVASHLIAHNKKRYGKTLFANSNDNLAAKVELYSAFNDKEEAAQIASEILHQKELKKPLSNIAILVRMSSQTRIFEDIFIQLGINYKIYGGQNFLDRKEIRDAIAYFSIIIDPKNAFAFDRIINQPKRGIGPKSLAHIHEISYQTGKPILETCQYMIDNKLLKPAITRSLTDFIIKIKYWQSLIDHLPPRIIAEKILEESGYRKLYDSKELEDEARLNNLDELINLLKDFTNFSEFLEYISLRSEVSQQQTDDAVNIMSLHSSKGLEFETVFLPGWEEEIFPSKKAIEEGSEEAIEEERRLAYVGITRAKKYLHIWFAQKRWLFNHTAPSTPSRFINELPKANIDIKNPSRNIYHPKTNYSNINSRKSYNTNSYNYKIEKDKSTATIFSINDRIFHLKFGNGTIIDVEYDKLFIYFDKAGPKHVLAKFVEKI